MYFYSWPDYNLFSRSSKHHQTSSIQIQIQIPRERKLTNVRARRLALKKKTPHKRTYRKANHIIDEKCPVTGTSFGQNSAIELELRDRVVESGSAQQAMIIAGPDPANPPIQAFGQFFKEKKLTAIPFESNRTISSNIEGSPPRESIKKNGHSHPPPSLWHSSGEVWVPASVCRPAAGFRTAAARPRAAPSYSRPGWPTSPPASQPAADSGSARFR